MKRIEEFGIRLTKIVMIALLLCVILPSAQAAKDGGGKVSVTEAAPSEALQGQELEVIISGSGFDDGSTAAYLVTGTKDDTQVEVISSEFLPGTGQLKTRIKVKGGAVISAYDIEVTTSRGRRGRGSTMFNVKQAGDVCIDTHFPTIVYAKEGPTIGKGKNRISTRNIYLTGNNGCTELAVAEGLILYVEFDGDLRMTIRDNQGYLAWLGRDADHYRIYGLSFSINSDSSSIDTQGFQKIYETDYSGNGQGFISGLDNRISDAGEVQIALVEFVQEELPSLRLYNVSSGNIEDIVTGDCVVTGSAGDCFRIYYSDPIWDPSGALIYFRVRSVSTTDDRRGIARIHKTESGWSAPEMIIMGPINESPVYPSISLSGLMTYQYDDGFINGVRDVRVGLVDPDICAADLCNVYDGELGVVRRGGAPKWTAEDTIITHVISGGYIEYTVPVNAIYRELDIGDASDLDTDL